MSRRLIVNADDFGLSEGINQGIVECAERGIVTSVSLMVRQPAARAAAAYARINRRLSAGLHVDLGEWSFRGGQWQELYTVVEARNPPAVAEEVERQRSEFLRLVGREPSHLDSHQHVHRDEPVRSILARLARELNVPLRSFDPRVRFCGDFYGQTGEGEPLPDAITVGNLRSIVADLPAGTTELGCHPGYTWGVTSVYRVERELEVKVLCDPALKSILQELKIELCSFDQLALAGNG
jgi:predicted glycoside hydrolase/deacetylase ChbG (UPF0249 family)